MPREATPENRERRRLATLAAACCALVAVLALALAGRAADPEAASAQASSRPNIVVLFTDDQETASLRVMKTLNKEMKRKGTTMKRFYDNFPLCCPARATLLTGQYAHNHQVLSNVPPDGGYGVFNELHGNNYLPLWLQAAGYQTSYVGKFENGYAEPDEYGTVPADVPRGWNDWHVLAPSRAQYFNYTLNENGALNQYGKADDQYSTTVFTNKARRFIRRSAKASQPFYLQLGYAAPHGGGGGDPGRSCNRAAVPDPADLGTLRDKLRKNLPASFNEPDVSDKPSPIADLAPLTEGQISDLLRKRRCAWESLLGVDRSVGEILAEIKRDGIRKNTYVFFLSDNGFMRGEHRVRNNKRFLYEPSARVPMVVRGPGIARNGKSNDVVTNADLASTFLELAGASPGLLQDGQSLLPSLANPKLERGRAILLEAYAGLPITGVRTSRYLYTEWETGSSGPPERELYDTYVDPDQLDNQAQNPAYASVVDELAAERDRLIDCAGADCYGAPTGQLELTTGGNGQAGCSFSPVVARFASPDEGRIQSVDFILRGQPIGTATGAPFEIGLQDSQLRPGKPVQLAARANFSDGRRLANSAKIKLCE